MPFLSQTTKRNIPGGNAMRLFNLPLFAEWKLTARQAEVVLSRAASQSEFTAQLSVIFRNIHSQE